MQQSDHQPTIYLFIYFIYLFFKYMYDEASRGIHVCLMLQILAATAILMLDT